jgi:hypothetical protein
MAPRTEKSNNCVDEARDCTGYHVTWCGNRDHHHDDDPYCSKLISSAKLITEGDVRKSQMWVSPTSAFTHGRFAPDEYAAREARYDGIELMVESWHGPDDGWTEQKIRVTSSEARTLAALLIRAADIEQGLDR